VHKLTLASAPRLRELLRSVVSASDEQRFLHRLHCALLVAEGRSCYEVARWFGEDPRTVERWVHALDMNGIEGLKEHHAGGRPARISAGLLESLTLDLCEAPDRAGYPEPAWSGRLLKRLLEDRYGIKLSPRQCQRLLRRLRHAGSPRPS
jgi:transposase